MVCENDGLYEWQEKHFGQTWETLPKLELFVKVWFVLICVCVNLCLVKDEIVNWTNCDFLGLWKWWFV